MDLTWIKDTIIRISLPYLGRSIYCSLHFQMQTMTTGVWWNQLLWIFYCTSYTQPLEAIQATLSEKAPLYHVHFIKICTEIRDYSNCCIFYFVLSLHSYYCVCCQEGYPWHQWEINFQRSFDSSFLSWKYQYLEELLYEKLLHNKKKKKKWKGSWTKAILGMQF